MGVARTYLPLGECIVHRHTLHYRVYHCRPSGHAECFGSLFQLLVRRGPFHPLCNSIRVFLQLRVPPVLGIRGKPLCPLEQLHPVEEIAMAGSIGGNQSRYTDDKEQAGRQYRA